MITDGAVELTSFMLVRNKTLVDFIAATKDIQVWLSKRAGFRRRHTFQDDSGRIYDLVFWDKEVQGVKAMEKLMTEFSDASVHAMINQRTVNWCVTPVFG